MLVLLFIFLVFLLGANESHYFSEYAVTLNGYDRNSKTIVQRTIEQIGVLLPFDDSSKLHQPNMVVQVEKTLTPEVKLIWLAPENGYGCVVLRAKVKHPTLGWFENEDALSKIICEQNDEL